MSDQDINVAYVANLARLNLTEDEVTHYTETIVDILAHVRELESYDVEGVQAVAHAVPVFDRMRDDVAGTSLPVDSVMINAPESAQDQIRVPKVVETA